MDTSRREALDLLRQSVARGVDEQKLPSNPLLKDAIRRLSAEQAVYLGVMDKGDSIKLLHVVQSELSQVLQKVGDSGDLETILLAERLVLDNERTYYADTPIMERSLDNALNEIDAALVMVNKIQDRDAYKSVTEDYFRSHKSRINGLPNDGARQFFKPHRPRIENLGKARSIGLDKALLEVRKNNLNVASGEYIKLQKIALAGPEPEPEVNRNTDNRR